VSQESFLTSYGVRGTVCGVCLVPYASK